MGIGGIERYREDKDTVTDEEEVSICLSPPQRILEDECPNKVDRCSCTQSHEESREAFAKKG